MSSATVEVGSLAGDEESLQYRALHTGALVGLMLGILSVSVVILAVDSFNACLGAALIPAVGVFVSSRSLAAIRRQPDQYTGATLATIGLALSLLFLIGGVSYGGYVYVNEVPEGYTRISFGAMKPDEVQEQGGVVVPPEIAALDGKKVFIKGYIRQDSITATRGIDEFLLVRDNQQCCFGDLSTVKYYDQIFVNTSDALRLNNSVQLVKIGGTLHVNPQGAAPAGQSSMQRVFSLTADYAKD